MNASSRKPMKKGAYYSTERNGTERLVSLNISILRNVSKTGVDTHPPYCSAELSCI